MKTSDLSPRTSSTRISAAWVMIYAIASDSLEVATSERWCLSSGGTTFVGTGFAVPAKGNCAPWSGFTKTASTVILTTSGAGCLSSDGKVLTVSVSSQDPSFFGAGQLQADYIQLCPAGVSSCPIGGGRDSGQFGGPAAPVTCSASLLSLPALHD